MDADTAIIVAALRGALLAIVALIWVIVLVRIVGLRSFSKMTSFDFVMTVSIGSLLAGASQSTGWPGYVQSLVAIAGLFAAQAAIASLRKKSSRFEDAVQNTPVILMRDGVVQDEALRATRVSRADLFAKLREANVSDLESVHAAILETTGDVTVLHGPRLDTRLLDKVRRV